MSAMVAGPQKRIGGSRQQFDEVQSPASIAKRRYGSIADSKMARMNLQDKLDSTPLGKAEGIEKVGSSLGLRGLKPPHRIPKIQQAVTASIADSKASTLSPASPTRDISDYQSQGDKQFSSPQLARVSPSKKLQ